MADASSSRSPSSRTTTSTARNSRSRTPKPASSGHRGHQAARKVRQQENVRISLPIVGPVDLPHPQQLAYLAGIGLLAALEVIEWPAALALAVGHTLVTQQHSRSLQELGDALDEV